MMLVIGMDEAGYGPNLGPLVVAATAWRVEHPMGFALPRLDDALLHSPDQAPMRFADSKQLYQSGSGLRLLERGVLAALGSFAPFPGKLAELEAILRCPVSTNAMHSSPVWQQGAATKIPVEIEVSDWENASTRFSTAAEQRGIELTRCAASLVHPREFNALCGEFGGKGGLLTHTSLKLLRNLIGEQWEPRETEPRPASAARNGQKTPARWSRCEDRAAWVVCDRHGGRQRYLPAIQHHFPEAKLTIVKESKEVSQYTIEMKEGTIHLMFQVKGEQYLQTALASMIAKYVRELSMREFNEFWRKHDAALRPTAGYPVDAKRFWKETERLRVRLGIPDQDLWRMV